MSKDDAQMHKAYKALFILLWSGFAFVLVPDVYFGLEVQERIDHVQAQVTRGECGKEQPCRLDNLVATTCRFLTGTQFFPALLTTRRLNEARVVFHAPEACSRGGGTNVVEALAR